MGYGERYFSDAIAQITGDSLGLFEKLGVDDNEFDSAIGDVCSEIIGAMEEGFLSSKASVVDKVMSGVVMGSRKNQLNLQPQDR